jgi:hypothetical protein
MYDCSDCLAISRWCAKGSRVRRGRWTEVVDYALECVGGWGGGVAGGLRHFDLSRVGGKCWGWSEELVISESATGDWDLLVFGLAWFPWKKQRIDVP